MCLHKPGHMQNAPWGPAGPCDHLPPPHPSGTRAHGPRSHWRLPGARFGTHRAGCRCINQVAVCPAPLCPGLRGGRPAHARHLPDVREGRRLGLREGLGFPTAGSLSASGARVWETAKPGWRAIPNVSPHVLTSRGLTRDHPPQLPSVPTLASIPADQANCHCLGLWAPCQAAIGPDPTATGSPGAGVPWPVAGKGPYVSELRSIGAIIQHFPQLGVPRPGAVLLGFTLFQGFEGTGRSPCPHPSPVPPPLDSRVLPLSGCRAPSQHLDQNPRAASGP